MRRDALRVACYVGGAVPALHGLIRAYATNWMAASDNAMVAIRALDVLTSSHHPLAGTPSSVSVSVSASSDLDLRHPGPILFDVLALPMRALGGDLGVPATMALLNGAFAIWAVWLAGRCAGLRAQVVVALVVGALSWSMGWFRLVEPYNPHAVMVPCLLLFVACWAIALGRRAGTLAAIAGGSFCLQVHIGFVYIVPFALLLAIGLRLLNLRAGRVDSQPWSARRTTLLSLVAGVLWIQPIIDVLLHGSDSNPLRLLRARGSSGDPLGVSLAIRIVASVVVVPPAWTRGGFGRLGVIDPPAGVVPSLLALLLVIAVASLLAWRLRDDVAVSSLVAFCAALLVASVVAVALVPVHELFGFAPHEFRWLWVVGVLSTAAIGWGFVELVRRTATWPAVRRRLDVVAGVAIGLVVLANVANVGAAAEPGLQPRDPVALRALLDDLPRDRLRGCDGIAVDVTMGFPGLEASAVLLALREADIEFGLRDLSVQIGFDRPASGREACLLTIADESPTAVPDEIARGAFVTLTLTETAG